MAIDPLEGIIWYVAFLFSVTFHEAAHAWSAMKGGDLTAYYGGQVTLDPIPHIRREPLGMVILPVISLILNGWPFGFASAPYDPAWQRRYPRKSALMALAGPLSNLVLVLVSACLIWLGILFGHFKAPQSIGFTMVTISGEPGFWTNAAVGVSILFSLNLILAVLNLFPLPPLDGSGVLTYFMTHEGTAKYQHYARRFSLLGLIIVWHIFWPIFSPIFAAAVSMLYPGVKYS